MQDGRDDNRGRLCDSRLDREQGNRPYRGGRKKAKDPLEARKARKEVLARREEPLARLPRRPCGEGPFSGRCGKDIKCFPGRDCVFASIDSGRSLQCSFVS